MALLRLFGPVREAAGRSEDFFSGETVGELLTAANERYGAAFTTIAARCAVWVNGETAQPADPIAEGDEVALLPPVSGG